MNNFIFNVKQLKRNKFIKCIWQLIISTSSATLEAPLLCPWTNNITKKEGKDMNRIQVLNKTITNPPKIANEFNNHFILIAKNWKIINKT